MANTLEALMILCFGLSWPISIRKSLVSRTAKGKSLFFEVPIWVGYIFGVARKFLLWQTPGAALLGTVTPFCSCSSIPLFIGFTSAGLPLGVTFSFLISSPMVDLGSLVLLMSIFGAKIAIVYVIVGLVIAVVGGTIIEKLHMSRFA